MQIEQAIHQKKPFKNEWQRAAVNLLFTSNWLKHHQTAILKKYGLTIQQYNVLRILKGADRPISTSVIRERLIDKMADTSRLAERMAQKNLVQRTPCADDKRLIDVSLSNKGIKLVNKVEEALPTMDDLLSELSQDEAKILNNLLDKLRGE